MATDAENVVHLILLVAALSVVLAAAQPTMTAGAQQGLPRCPAADEMITTSPPAYVRKGASLAFTVERAGEDVAQVTVVYPAAAGQRTESFVFPEGEMELRVIRPGPVGVRSFDLHFEWQQSVGEPDAPPGATTTKTSLSSTALQRSGGLVSPACRAATA